MNQLQKLDANLPEEKRAVVRALRMQALDHLRLSADKTKSATESLAEWDSYFALMDHAEDVRTGRVKP